MPIVTEDQRDRLLLRLYQLREAFQDIRAEVHATYPPDSEEREAFARARLAVDTAIIDLENEALGSVAAQMNAAKAPIDTATRELRDKVDDFNKIADGAEKAAKVVGLMVKILDLVT
ncbi:hypothetical protein [uncultured Rhodospira sp.]|uniref:hypothetical protein n=1 Tax=uncultured Rhodospira sp. TaxID=1936189 RepID=UPI0026018323|nr:hypothetical protein [uncultured Rhodospira sp.]